MTDPKSGVIGELTTRAELRRAISQLAQRKQAAADRVVTRRWAGDVTRTDDELAERFAELTALADLPQPRRARP